MQRNLLWHGVLFFSNLWTHYSLPELSKKKIVPIPKKPALTSCIMKIFQKYMVFILKTNVNTVDPLQFAYSQGCSTEDAVNTVTYFINLENAKAYTRLLFVDFRFAFNTIKPHLLIQKLKALNVNHFLIRWYLSFLIHRTQQVRVNHTL